MLTPEQLDAMNPLNIRPSGVPVLHDLLEQRIRWRSWDELRQYLVEQSTESSGTGGLSSNSVAVGHYALAQMTRGCLNFCIGPAVGSALSQAMGQLIIALPQRRLLVADLFKEHYRFQAYSDDAALVALNRRQLAATAPFSSLHVGAKLPLRSQSLHSLHRSADGPLPQLKVSAADTTDTLFETSTWAWLNNVWNERWDTLPTDSSFNVIMNGQFMHPQFRGNFNLFYGATVGTDVLAADGTVIIELPESRLFIADLVAETAAFLNYSDEAAMVAPQYHEHLS